MKEKKPNRKERRQAELGRMLERRREKLRAESQPTHEPLLDAALGSLFSAVGVFDMLGWSAADVATKVAAYMGISRSLREELDQLVKDSEADGEGYPPSMTGAEFDELAAGLTAGAELVRREQDLLDPIVLRTVEFLHSDEGRALNRLMGA